MAVFSSFFPLFPLYLMGDVFYRWDAFKLYSSFIEFVPSVSLASIMWNLLALCTSLVVWFPIRLVEQLYLYAGLQIKREN
jgi:hypothetical protein